MTEGGSMTKMDVVCLYIPNASKASVAQWFRREVHAERGDGGPHRAPRRVPGGGGRLRAGRGGHRPGAGGGPIATNGCK